MLTSFGRQSERWYAGYIANRTYKSSIVQSLGLVPLNLAISCSNFTSLSSFHFFCHGQSSIGAFQASTLSLIRRNSFSTVPKVNEKDIVAQILKQLDGADFPSSGKLLTQLSKSNQLWSDLPSSTRATIRGKFLGACNEPNQKNLEGFSFYLLSFSNMKYKWISDNELLGAFLKKMATLLQNQDPVQLVRNIPILTHQLGKAGIKASSIPSGSIDSLLEAIGKSVEKCTSQGIANIFHGLGAMEIQWKQIPNEVRMNLEKSLLKNMSKFTPLSFMSFLLGSIGMEYRCRWHHEQQLIELLYQRILSIMVKENNQYQQMNDIRIFATIVYSMGKFGMEHYRLPSSLSTAIYEELPKVLGKSLNDHDLANIFHGLGEMRFQWNKLPESTKQSIEQKLFQQFHKNSDFTFSSLLNAFINMKFPWFSQEPIREAVYRRILLMIHRDNQNIREETGKYLINMIYSLGESGVTKDVLSNEMTQALINVIPKLVQLSNKQSLPKLIYPLGKIGIPWDSFSETSQRAMEQIFLRRIHELDDRTMGSFLIGCAGMNYHWYENHQIKHEIFQKLLFMFNPIDIDQESAKDTAVHLNKVLSAMGKVGLRKDMMDPMFFKVLMDFIERYSTKFSRIGVANLFHSLGAMNIQWSDIPEETRSALDICFAIGRVQGFTNQSLSDFLIGCTKMKFLWFEHEKLNHEISRRLCKMYLDDADGESSSLLPPPPPAGPENENSILEETEIFTNIVYAMGDIGLKEKHFTKETYSALIAGLKKFQKKLSTQQKSRITRGFQQMKASK